jgi:hypothetical protein
MTFRDALYMVACLQTFICILTCCIVFAGLKEVNVFAKMDANLVQVRAMRYCYGIIVSCVSLVVIMNLSAWLLFVLAE